MDKIEEAKKILIELVDETLKACKADITSKDGYVVMMILLAKIPEKHRKSFLLLCISKGYSKTTGLKIINILGL